MLTSPVIELANSILTRARLSHLLVLHSCSLSGVHFALPQTSSSPPSSSNNFYPETHSFHAKARKELLFPQISSRNANQRRARTSLMRAAHLHEPYMYYDKQSAGAIKRACARRLGMKPTRRRCDGRELSIGGGNSSVTGVELRLAAPSYCSCAAPSLRAALCVWQPPSRLFSVSQRSRSLALRADHCHFWRCLCARAC